MSNEKDQDQGSCTIKKLPDRLLKQASHVAVKINATNAPVLATLGASASLINPQFLTILTSKYWGTLQRRFTVSFIPTTTPADLKARILSHMNAWQIGITFMQTQGVGQIRIAFGPGGYWSYLGTDVLLIPKHQPTMNLEGFTMKTPESEFKRVIRHETGHTLAFPHEHMRKELIERIDPQKAYDYFLKTQGWNKTVVDQQVLTPLSEESIMGTPPDQTSIMCYQLPGSITRDGLPIVGGIDINATDSIYAKKMYPTFTKPDCAVVLQKPEFWDESEDVSEPELTQRLNEFLQE